MKTKVFLSLFLILALITSCEQAFDDVNNYDPDGLLSRIENDEGTTIAKYTYNRNGVLKNIESFQTFFAPGEKASFDYHFDDNGKLLKKEGFQPGNMFMSSFRGAADSNIETDYNYNNDDKIETITSVVDYESDDFNYTSNLSYEYPDSKTIIESFNIIDPAANSVTNYREYHVNNDGNIYEILHYTINNTEGKHIYSFEEYTYDNKKTPYEFEPFPMSKNNRLSMKLTAYNYDEYGNQSIAYTSEYSYKMEYNAQNYPVKVTETYQNGNTEVKYYFYKN